MTPTISSLLKGHPVNLKENLIKICDALGIQVNSADVKKQKMQTDIEELVKTYEVYEQTVKDMACEMKKEYISRKTEKSTNQPSTQTQLLFDDTQSQEEPPYVIRRNLFLTTTTP